MQTQTIPTIGRIVIYTPTKEEKDVMASVAGHCNVQNELPAIIVAVHGEEPDSTVNLKVFMDGDYVNLWKTSASQAAPSPEGIYPEGSWHWPQIRLKMEMRFDNGTNQTATINVSDQQQQGAVTQDSQQNQKGTGAQQNQDEKTQTPPVDENLNPDPDTHKKPPHRTR